MSVGPIKTYVTLWESYTHFAVTHWVTSLFDLDNC